MPGFRVRIIPVLGTIPAIFGQVMASYVVTQLAGLCIQTEPVVNLDLDHYRILHQRLLEHEELIYGSAEQVLVWNFVSIYYLYTWFLLLVSVPILVPSCCSVQVFYGTVTRMPHILNIILLMV